MTMHEQDRTAITLLQLS